MKPRCGMKVVCVDDRVDEQDGRDPLVRKGQTYTIAGWSDRCLFGGLGVMLREFLPRPYPDRMYFHAWRFAEVRDRKAGTETGMEILRDIARKPRKPVRSPEKV